MNHRQPTQSILRRRRRKTHHKRANAPKSNAGWKKASPRQASKSQPSPNTKKVAIYSSSDRSGGVPKKVNKAHAASPLAQNPIVGRIQLIIINQPLRRTLRSRKKRGCPLGAARAVGNDRAPLMGAILRNEPNFPGRNRIPPPEIPILPFPQTLRVSKTGRPKISRIRWQNP